MRLWTSNGKSDWEEIKVGDIKEAIKNIPHWGLCIMDDNPNELLDEGDEYNPDSEDLFDARLMFYKSSWTKAEVGKDTLFYYELFAL